MVADLGQHKLTYRISL